MFVFINLNQKHSSSIKHCFWSFSNIRRASILLKTSRLIPSLSSQRQGTWPNSQRKKQKKEKK